MDGASLGVFEFEVRTSRGSYAVVIGQDMLQSSSESCTNVVMDQVLEPTFGHFFETWIPFEASEFHKTLAGCERLLIEMHRRDMNRSSSLLAVGGGSLQDVSTMCSSIYMRGVPWTYAPTTAMAMLDSCIGGKSSINVSGVKNLVGNIYPPQQVVIDIRAADSLSMPARVSGMSEAVKICFAGGDAFDQYLSVGLSADEFSSGPGAQKSMSLIDVSLRTKRWFIEIDEFDKKERLLLNFGHTFGHALEAATDFRIPHGVAVGLGMLAAIHHPLSARSERVSDLRSYVLGLLRSIPEITNTVRVVDWDRFEKAVLSDKKGSKDSIRLILPAKRAPLEQVDVPRGKESVQRMSSCMREALSTVWE